MKGQTNKCGGVRGPERSFLIHPLLRYRAPHTAPGILYVAGVPRDDVEVEVHHRLAGGGANVRADVVAGGVVPVVEEVLCFPGEGEEGGEFCVGRVEEAGDVPEGDEEEVAGACRVFVIAGVAEVVCEQDLISLRVAEGAGQIAHASYPRTWMR